MTEPANLYLDLMKKCLTHSLWGETLAPFAPPNRPLYKRIVWGAFRALLAKRGLRVCSAVTYDARRRDEGRDWPPMAETMIGHKRLSNIQSCIESVLERGVPGDLIETGVWRGGSTIFMRAVLRAYGAQNRTVWVADSFDGVPPPDAERYPADKGDNLFKYRELAVPLEQVRANFAKYDLLDDRVRFVKGLFKDTLPEVPIDRLALMRLDGDLYESTMDALTHLYPKLSVGGYVLVDDYALAGCQRAVDDFRSELGITDELVPVDWTGVYWQRH